ncbi:TPA: hypothetical protein SMS45_000357 [Pseudomonas aeruginosa]|uniref:hypothetical protein n=1 Tax=Pseudomonas aeruginosa TaxID=287 RepID=UPI0009A2D3D3|nr:hypothetical protein [Pseudomonas aeruginosa]ELJ2659671.1 hypothetical protein [Pseudomonas aeruginosa]MCS9379228.1 hypothetical protein [Pseudomonas aeruginosa]HBP5079848.1 hypothetical protein [Pseudomonas aeruginosa]HBP6280114.1 hypothetical protein [Pseudomonas aeruginosa]HCL4344346.1 hypothetical protein [Pseudomonas aeruginosa]
MILTELLAQCGIRTALIVDDVYDAVPSAADIDPGNEAWANFNDDLTPEQRSLIIERYPAAKDARFDECVDDDNYVAAVWQLREELRDVVAPVFETYIADQVSDDNYVRRAKERLERLQLTVQTAGRNFSAAARDVDLIVIDLFFGKAQDPASLNESKTRLREALQQRLANPPLVILMSRSSRLESKRDEFRDDVGLLDSGFRILRKDDLENTDRLELQLERLAENSGDSRALARLFHALESGVMHGAERTLRLLRKLRLSDVGQIHQLLLDAEGQPAGSYLVDIFDRVLQHEIEREIGIIDAALALNGFSTTKYPPPYVAGSPDLQELVQRLLAQNENRLRLPGAIGVRVAFGDLLRIPPGVEADRLQRAILVDLNAENVLLVLTPACDLQRGAAPRVLLLVGTVKPIAVKDWSYGDDARTPAIRIDGELCWVKWNLKHIDTVSHHQLEMAFEAGNVRLVGRLREGHALELQQRVLAGLGRVGQMAALPATFPVELEVFYPDRDGRLKSLDVEALGDGAVCFVGRGEDGMILRLVMTEPICDGVLSELASVDEQEVAEAAQQAFRHVRSSPDLRRLMIQGLDLKGVNAQGWREISSETGAANGVRKMGLIAWNYEAPDEPLPRSNLNKAGIIFLIRDAGSRNIPGLGDAIRSGLIEPAGEHVADSSED